MTQKNDRQKYPLQCLFEIHHQKTERDLRGRCAGRYLKRSLALQPNPSFDTVRRRIERELQTDQASETTYGMRLALRYEGAAIPDAAARKLAQEFEAQINKVIFQLGCRFNDRISVIVRTQENYQQATGAAEWSGGRYDGRIHIAVPPSGEVDQYVRQTFAHEFVHACLARRGPWPSWFHEGMAQKISGRTLTPQARDILTQLNQADQLPTLAQLNGGWARHSCAGDRSTASVDISGRDVGQATCASSNSISRVEAAPLMFQRVNPRLAPTSPLQAARTSRRRRR